MNKSENPFRLLIADSQFLITKSLKSILQEEDPFNVINIVSEKNEILKELTLVPSLLLIIDPLLVDFSSISELKEIKNSFPDLKILVITTSMIKSELHELNLLGITNIILKTSSREEIIEAVYATIFRNFSRSMGFE